MRRQPKKLLLHAFCLIASYLTMLGSSQASPEKFYGGHLSVVDGSVSIQSPTDETLSPAELNLLVEEGTRLLTAHDGRAEVQLSGNDVLRIWHDTEVDFIDVERSVEMWMRMGSVYVRTSPRRSEDCGLKVVTPTSTVCIPGATILRIDVEDEGRTRVSVLKGNAEVFIESESLFLDSSQTVTVSTTRLYGPIRLRIDHRDRFIRWCSDRDELLGSPLGHQYLPLDVPAARELDDYGSWVYVPEVRLHVWRPRVVIGWSPYHHGRWTWSIRYGWFWVSNEPWGWIPYHYGSWSWYARWGWVWVPGAVWHGARVNWVVCGDYIGWRPLLYRHRHITVKIPARHHKYYFVHKTSIRRPHRRIVKLEKSYVNRHKILSVRTPTSIVGAPKRVRKVPTGMAIKRTYGERKAMKSVQHRRHGKDHVSYASRKSEVRNRDFQERLAERRAQKRKNEQTRIVGRGQQIGKKTTGHAVRPARRAEATKVKDRAVNRKRHRDSKSSEPSKQVRKANPERSSSANVPRAVRKRSEQRSSPKIRGHRVEQQKRFSKPRSSYRAPRTSERAPTRSSLSGRARSVAPHARSISPGRVRGGRPNRR